MKKDPLGIATSLVYHLNLLRENVEYNINELKNLRNIENHWKTIQKYLKMFKIIKKYCPQIELNESKLTIKESELYKRLNPKERLILYLFNEGAKNADTAVEIPNEFQTEELGESEGYLYKRTEENKFHLTRSGLNIYRLIKQNWSKVIYQKESFNDIFPYEASFEESYVAQNSISEGSGPIIYVNTFELRPSASDSSGLNRDIWSLSRDKELNLMVR
ncbi:MAG: hypothetical protein R6U96_19425 [Promethearchaeia archaeon]